MLVCKCSDSAKCKFGLILLVLYVNRCLIEALYSHIIGMCYDGVMRVIPGVPVMSNPGKRII